MSEIGLDDVKELDPESMSDGDRVEAIRRMIRSFYEVATEDLLVLSSYQKLLLLRWVIPLADDDATDKWQEEDYQAFDAAAPEFVRLGPEDKRGFRAMTFASPDEAAASSERTSTADIDAAGDAVPEQKPRKSMFNPEEFDPSFQKETDDMATKPATKKKTKNQEPGTKNASDEIEYRIDTEIVLKPVSWFYRSPYDTRERRTPEWVEELAKSLKEHQQLIPCLARPDGQLIAGHTRVLAAQLAGLEHLKVCLVHCDDLTARTLVLIENAKRRDLTLRERCSAYVDLQADYKARGKSEKELLKELGIERSTLSNITRLKSLPDEVWERFDADRLSTDQLREIATHAMVPGFAAAVLKVLDRDAADIRPGKMVFSDAMAAGFEAAYRPMGKGQVDFKLTEKLREQLGITTVDHPRLGKIQVATNAEAWDKLQKKAAEKKKASTPPSETVTPAKPPTEQREQDDRAAKKAQKERAAELRKNLITSAWLEAHARAIRARFAKPRKADYPLVVRLMLLMQTFLPPVDVGEIIEEDEKFYETIYAKVIRFFTVGEVSLANYEDLNLEEMNELSKWLAAPALPHWMPSKDLIKTLTDKELLQLRDDLTLEEGVMDTEREELEERVMDEWQPGKLGDGWCPDVFQLSVIY